MSRLDSIVSASNGPFIYERRSPGTRVDGTYVEGTLTTASINGSLQPASGKQLADLPEGRLATSTMMFYTTTQLQTGASPDILIDGNDRYEVVNVKKWNAFGEIHYECLVTRLNQP